MRGVSSVSRALCSHQNERLLLRRKKRVQLQPPNAPAPIVEASWAHSGGPGACAAELPWVTTLANLAYYSRALLHVCKGKGYRLMRGQAMFGQGRPKEVNYTVVEIISISEGEVRLEVERKPWMLRVPVGAAFVCPQDPTLKLMLTAPPDQSEAAEGAPLALQLRLGGEPRGRAA